MANGLRTMNAEMRFARVAKQMRPRSVEMLGLTIGRHVYRITITTMHLI